MKPSYHQSTLVNYLRCPKMFSLPFHENEKPLIGKGTLDTMREGQLFEGYVLGFKSDKNEAELIGRKKTETIDIIKVHANQIKPLFKNGESYVKIEKEFSEYSLAGEADHIGQLDWDYIKTLLPDAQPEGESINDLKYTGSLDWVWADKQEFKDYLQALMYVGIHYLITGDLLPFVYIVVENQYTNPIIHINKVFVQKSDIEEKLIPFVDMVHNDLFYQPKAGNETCLGGKKGSRCWYLHSCKEGRKFLGGYKVTEFGLLNYQ